MRYGYVRISTDLQEYNAQKQGISSKYVIDEWVEDTGTGRVTQPNLSRLIYRAKAGDEIVVYAFDRLGRNTQAVIGIANTLRNRNVGIISIREGIDLNSPSGNMVFQMMCSIAEFEASLIADRVRAGLKAAKERGVKLGRKRLDANAEAIPFLDMAKSWRKEGKSLRAINALIQSRGGKISYGALQKYLADAEAH